MKQLNQNVDDQKRNDPRRKKIYFRKIQALFNLIFNYMTKEQRESLLTLKKDG